MPRIRTIKPEFWDSPGTADASFAARLLYIAMWNWADDWGVGSAHMKSLAAFAFPNDDDITASELPTLAKEVSACFDVVFYEVDRRPYYAILSWDKHQRTERKAKRLNPPPPEDVLAGQATVTVLPLGDLGSSDAQSRKSVRGNRGTGEQGNRGTNTCASTDVEREFDEWYARYPRKKSRGSALTAYKKAHKKVDAQTLLDVIDAQADRLMAKGPDFAPHPATWLNGERWDDEPDTGSQQTHPTDIGGPAWMEQRKMPGPLEYDE